MMFTDMQVTTYETLTCGVCGVPFALTADMHASMKRGERYYCPNGHHITYTKTEAQKLREQLEAKEIELRRAKCEMLAEKGFRERVESQRDTAERKLRRAHKGVCPCCNRSFLNLQRHMKTKHPEIK